MAMNNFLFFGKKNKRGWIKMLEVMIAITILSGAIMFIYSSKTYSVSLESYIYPYQKEILSEISNNDTLRNYVLSGNDTALVSAFSLPSNLEFNMTICDLDGKACNMDNDLFILLREQEIYADEIIVSSNLTKFEPKKVKLFIWSVY